MSRLLSRLASLVWWSLLVVLVLLALYAAIGRQLTANIHAYKDDLAAILAEESGLEIRIGRLSSRWDWLDPTLIASDLEVRTPDNDLLDANLEYLRLRLDFWSSLRRWRLVFEDLDADGLALTVIKPEALSLDEAADRLASAGASEDSPDWLALAGQWLSDPQARVTRVNIHVGHHRDSLRDFYLPQLDLIYRQGLFQAAGRAMESGTANQLASFALVGQHFFRGDFTGQLYVDVDSGRVFDELVGDLSWRDIRVAGVDLGGQAWLTFDQGRLAEIQGTVSTPYLQLVIGEQSLSPLENIQARFGWRPGDALVLRQLQWQSRGVAVEPFSLRLQHRADGLALVADELPLGPIRGLLQSLPVLPSMATDALANYRPSGYLDDLFLLLPEQLDQFRLSARVRDGSVRAWQGTPHATGIQGRLQLDAAGGFIDLDNQQPVTVGFPQLFSREWTIDSLAGRVSWRLEGPIIRAFSSDLRARYRQDARFTGAFDLRLDREGEDNLGVRVGVENADAAWIDEFVPGHILDEGLHQWLTGSIRGGRVIAGEYYGHGRIDRGAPRGSFTSSMWYEFEQGHMRYDPAWPEVTDATGRVQVHNQRARVTLEQARSGGLVADGAVARLLPADASVPPRLQVELSSLATGADVSWWLSNTPLGQWSGELLRNADYTGEFQLGLGLELPLVEGAQPVVQARVQTSGAQFELPQANVGWRNIRSDLTYHTRQGFSGGPLQAEFFGQPVAVHLAMTDEGNGLSARQTGRLPMPEFLQQMGLGENVSLGLGGALDYEAEVSMDSQGTPTVALSSDLTGLRVDWPEPMAKTADEAAPLTATLDPFAEGGINVAGRWQDRLAFELQLKNSGFDLVFPWLTLGRHELDQITVNALDMGDHWIVHTDSERAAGRFVLPGDGGVIEADLQTLHLSREGQPAVNDTEFLTLEEQLEAFRDLEMGSWPDVDVSIARLVLGEEEAGSWDFQLRPQSGQLHVQALTGQLGSLRLEGDLLWSIVRGQETSRFQGSLTGGALRDLGALTGSPIPLTNKKTEVELDLSWPGNPNDVVASQLDGSIRGRLDDGVILEQSGSAQLFRVFNLLNTDTLWRRLQLDFSDLYEAGVSFDAISGKAQIVDGLLTLDPELQLAGPSGAFKLSGNTDLASGDLDMRLVVVLPVTQNLPLAAVLFGAGAPIGGALFVLDKLLGDPLSRLTSATYDVTGSWNEPQVELRGVFDTD